MCYAQPPVYHGGGPAEAVETPEAAAVDVTASRSTKRPRTEPPAAALVGATPAIKQALPQEVGLCEEAEYLTSCYLRTLGFLGQLQALHPACRLIPPECAPLALVTYKEYAAAAGLTPLRARFEALRAQAALAACLWVSIKFLASPACVPDAPFIARATGVPVQLLLDHEPAVLQAVGWNMMRLCRAAGLCTSAAAPAGC